MTKQESIEALEKQLQLLSERSEESDWLSYGLLSLRNRLVLHQGNIRDGMTEEAQTLNEALSCQGRTEGFDELYERHEAYWVNALNLVLSILTRTHKDQDSSDERGQ